MASLAFRMALPYRGLTIAFLSLALGEAAFSQGAPPALPVSVAKPVQRRVIETADFTGRFQGSAQVQITSRVTGTIDSAPFKEGSLVKAGDILFVIDARPLQAAVDQTKAGVQGAQTRLDLTRANLTRAEELRRTGNITDAAFQSNQQAFLEAQANLSSAQAALQSATLNLEFSQIKAPISGRVGLKLVTSGNLVIANATTPLTTLVAVEPAYFYFDVDEATFLASKRANAASQGERMDAQIALPDEKTFAHKGVLDFIAPQVDAATGTVTARAVVSNPDGFLAPGLFGRVRVAISPPYDAFVLPALAVGTSGQGHFVMIVNADGTAAPKPVEAGPTVGTLRVVRKGLTADDQVVINGLMRARPGSKVVPQPTTFEAPDDLSTLLPGPAAQSR